VIDELYRGIPHVVMTNVMMVTAGGYTNIQPLEIKKGEKLAQLIMNPYSEHYYLVQVEKVDTDTARGEGGFGSTGK
jgi:dUTPase